jgi:DHA2 family multidrug resistance protein
MGFSDTFAVVGIVLVLAGIALLLTGKPKEAVAGGGH